MPSIPQSLLWISLVVLWLFVLVPMLISKRDAVRRTSDVALATRVLTGTASGRLLKRAGPASGHRSDPDWRPSEGDLDETFDDDDYEDDYEAEEDEDESEKTVVLAAPAVDVTESEYLDVDVIEEPAGALPVGASAVDELTLFEEPEETEDVAEVAEVEAPEEVEAVEENVDTAIYHVASDEYEDEDDGTADEYEYVDDSSGLEAADESDLQMADTIVAARRGRYDPAKAAAISARKYKFRKRMLAFMTLVMLGSAAAAYFMAPTVAPWGWYVCGGTAGVTLLYLGYLRRQTAHRGTAAAAARQAVRACPPRRGEHRGPRYGPGPVAAAQARSGRVGDRRRGPDVRASRLRARELRLRPAKGRRTVIAVSPARLATGSLCYRPGAMAQLVARLVRIEEVRGSNPLSSTLVYRSPRPPAGAICRQGSQLLMRPAADPVILVLALRLPRTPIAPGRRARARDRRRVACRFRWSADARRRPMMFSVIASMCWPVCWVAVMTRCVRAAGVIERTLWNAARVR